MTIISLTDKLNERESNLSIKLKDYYIDDVEVSALNFILPYQDINPQSIDELLVESLIRPLNFCNNLYNAGIYSVNQECVWGDNQIISNSIKQPNQKLIFNEEQFKFYSENIGYFGDDVTFFRDCLNQYIQGFLDEFNEMYNLPFSFGTSKSDARKIVLKNGNEGILEIISMANSKDLNLGFRGICTEFGNSQPIFYKKSK